MLTESTIYSVSPVSYCQTGGVPHISELDGPPSSAPKRSLSSLSVNLSV